MEEIMTGEATPAQFGAFVIGLRLKGETVDEMTGLATVMRNKSLKVDFSGPSCGHLWDGRRRFGYFQHLHGGGVCSRRVPGIAVAKHGNRAMTSKSGSADVLEKQGVKIDLGPEGVKRCMEEVGIGFMFAPRFHPAMKFAVQPRREIGVRTVFNILGPLDQSGRDAGSGFGCAHRLGGREDGAGAAKTGLGAGYCSARRGRVGRDFPEQQHERLGAQGQRRLIRHYTDRA